MYCFRRLIRSISIIWFIENSLYQIFDDDALSSLPYLPFLHQASACRFQSSFYENYINTTFSSHKFIKTHAFWSLPLRYYIEESHIYYGCNPIIFGSRQFGTIILGQRDCQMTGVGSDWGAGVVTYLRDSGSLTLTRSNKVYFVIRSNGHLS